jgi:uncharacterized protein
MRAIDALEAGKHVDVAGLPAPLRPLFYPGVQGYLIDAYAHDPARLAAAARLPMLIEQGARDIQVSEADARALATAQPHAKLAIVPGVNHVLKLVATDDRAANLATYRDPALPLAPGVVEPIVAFVKAH